MSIDASYRDDPQTEMVDYKALANISNGLALSTNIIVVLNTVIMIYPTRWWVPGAWDTPYDLYKEISFIFVHSYPLIASTINMFFLSDTIIYMSDVWYVIVFGIAYNFVSLTWSYINNLIIYPYMLWETW